MNIDVRTPWWPRLAGRLVISGVLLVAGVWGWRWLGIGNGGGVSREVRHDKRLQPAASDTLDQMPPDDPADALARFVAADSPSLDMERAWISGAVVRLARAIGALIDASRLDSSDVRIAVTDLRARGRALALINPDALTRADIAREAFVWASTLLSTLQQQQYPRDETLAARIGQLDAQARAIRPDEPLAAQRHAVIGFFREAADLIQQMAHDKRTVLTESSGT